ncbi:hypothetical protein [Streptomyces lushanensis]|uniref:hypothetical protein n=1 Tax=Streptomyces lushanensis TaxID=1434255 RepID=UPI00114CA6E5|nr:hypothetical protein [Streptomyces lushanensis]
MTREVEILGSLELSTGLSYRFSPTRSDAHPARPGAEAEWTAGTPQKFGNRDFSVGEIISIDYDPEYSAFFYPAGKYPVIRLWPISCLAFLAGGATAVFGITGLN